MKYNTVKEVLAAISPIPEEDAAREAARRHWASVAKPLGSLGLLETALEDVAALTLSADVDLSRPGGADAVLGQRRGAPGRYPGRTSR